MKKLFTIFALILIQNLNSKGSIFCPVCDTSSPTSKILFVLKKNNSPLTQTTQPN
jgi:hypothetical protein